MRPCVRVCLSTTVSSAAWLCSTRKHACTHRNDGRLATGHSHEAPGHGGEAGGCEGALLRNRSTRHQRAAAHMLQRRTYECLLALHRAPSSRQSACRGAWRRRTLTRVRAQKAGTVRAHENAEGRHRATRGRAHNSADGQHDRSPCLQLVEARIGRIHTFQDEVVDEKLWYLVFSTVNLKGVRFQGTGAHGCAARG